MDTEALCASDEIDVAQDVSTCPTRAPTPEPTVRIVVILRLVLFFVSVVLFFVYYSLN